MPTSKKRKLDFAEIDEPKPVKRARIAKKPNLKQSKSSASKKSQRKKDSTQSKSSKPKKAVKQKPKSKSKKKTETKTKTTKKTAAKPKKSQKNSRKKSNTQKQSNKKQQTKSKYANKSIQELKDLCRKKYFRVSGSKSALIHRLEHPKEEIIEMKRAFHNQRYNSKNACVYCDKNDPNAYWTAMAKLRQLQVFDPNRYVWKQGKVSLK